jgi:hypothetical protein
VRHSNNVAIGYGGAPGSGGVGGITNSGGSGYSGQPGAVFVYAYQ